MRAHQQRRIRLSPALIQILDRDASLNHRSFNGQLVFCIEQFYSEKMAVSETLDGNTDCLNPTIRKGTNSVG